MDLIGDVRELARTGVRWMRYQRLSGQTDLALDFWSNRDSLQIWKNIWLNGEYDLELPIDQTATIIDVGAHYGYFSLYAQRHLTATSKIYSLEPDPSNFEVLRKNIEQGSGCIIEPMDLALSDRGGLQSLALGKSFNSGFYSRKDRGAISVKTLSLAEFLDQANIAEVDFMKIDCEGAEFPILLSSDKETLRKCRIISMEFHERAIFGHEPRRIVDHLSYSGFETVLFEHAKDANGNKMHFGKIVARRL